MTRIFFDAIEPKNMPKDGDGYLGYDDGNWPDAAEEATMFPGKVIGKITTNPAHNYGSIGDGPPDNGTWPQWVGWVEMRRAAGEDPTINTNTSNWDSGKEAFREANVPDPHWWIAHYLNSPPDLKNLPPIPDGAVALQCYDYGGYDISVVADYWPGVDPKPAPTTSVDEEEINMKYETTCNPTTGRAGIGFADGACNTFQVTADKGTIPAGGTWRFVIVLDTGPFVIAENVTAPNGKIVQHIPSQFFGKASGVITYGPKGVEYELYAQ